MTCSYFVPEWPLRLSHYPMNQYWQDLPAFIKAQGFSGVELSDRSLRSLGEASAYALGEGLAKADVALIIDINCDLTLMDLEAWQAEVRYVIQCIKMATTLNAKLLRIAVGGQSISIQKLLSRERGDFWPCEDTDVRRPAMQRVLTSQWLRQLSHQARVHWPVSCDDDKIEQCVRAFHEITFRAEAASLPLAIENHWGVSSNPEAIAEILKPFPRAAVGVCLDAANFPRKVAMSAVIEKLVPRTLMFQAKAWHLQGGLVQGGANNRVLLSALRAQTFSGPITLEYEGVEGISGCHALRASLEPVV